MNDAILSLLITSVAALLALLVRYSFYSKCDVVKCCCCEIHRAVGAEGNTPEMSVAVTTPRGTVLQEQKSFSKV
jgi:hypothetical protein